MARWHSPRTPWGAYHTDIFQHRSGWKYWAVVFKTGKGGLLEWRYDIIRRKLGVGKLMSQGHFKTKKEAIRHAEMTLRGIR